MNIAIVGAGRVGIAFAVRLRAAGHRIVAAAGRDRTAARVREHLGGVPVLPGADAARRAELVMIATPDDAIAAACAEVVSGGGATTGTIVSHVSGATGLEALRAAEDVGATVLCVHPLQTFPDVGSAIARMAGAPMAVTARTDAGLAIGERIALDAGGRPFVLEDDAKPVYHAAAVFASNYLVTITALARDAGRAAGLADAVALLAPLQATTLENVGSMGPEGALTGPVVRADAGTIERHLRALADAVPSAVRPYVALARATLDVAEASGRLDAVGRAGVEEVLDRWT
jgi:predicted short-subunit dehydrogenase-like oxidoreductase (DUF2520 family)